MASRVDLPTPEPANSPSRWPCRVVVKQSSARTPRSSRGPSRARAAAGGGAARTGRGTGPCGSSPPPSSGRPSGSITRPSQASEGASVPPSPSTKPVAWRRTGINDAAPGPSPSSEPNAMVRAKAPRNPTTSARTGPARPGSALPGPWRGWSRRRLPTASWPERPATSAMRPERLAIRPVRCSGGMPRNVSMAISMHFSVFRCANGICPSLRWIPRRHVRIMFRFRPECPGFDTRGR